MSAIGYVRVSTEKQVDKGCSLEAQAEKIRAMAVVHSLPLLDIIVDAGESAKSLNRPGMTAVLGIIQSGKVKTVIVAKLDRLTRSVRDLCELLEVFNRASVSLVSVAESLDTATAAGRLVLNIMASVSQWERECIGERTKAVLNHKKTNRKAYGVTPLGYRRAGDALTPDTVEMATILELRQMRAEGRSLRSIATEFNRRGVPTKTGGAWYASTVKYLLENALYENAA